MAFELVDIDGLCDDLYTDYLGEVEFHFELIKKVLEENEASAFYSNVEITTDLPEKDIKSNFIKLCKLVLSPFFNENDNILEVREISRQENYVIKFNIVWKKYLDC
jgi:hypothetical protein